MTHLVVWDEWQPGACIGDVLGGRWTPGSCTNRVVRTVAPQQGGDHAAISIATPSGQPIIINAPPPKPAKAGTPWPLLGVAALTGAAAILVVQHKLRKR